MSVGKANDAIASFRTTLEIAQQRLALNPNLPFWKRAVELAYAGLGDAQLSRPASSQQDVATLTGEALESYTKAYDIAMHLASESPDNSQWKLDLWFALSRLARVKTARGEALVALDYLQQGSQVLKDLVAANADIASYRDQLGTAYWQIGTAKFMQGQTADAAVQFTLSVSELREAVKLSPGMPLFQHDLATAYFALGQAQFMTGSMAESLSSLRQCLEVRKQLHSEDLSNGQWEVELFQAETTLGSMPNVASAERVDALEAARKIHVEHTQANRQPPLPPGSLEAIDGQLRALGVQI